MVIPMGLGLLKTQLKPVDDGACDLLGGFRLNNTPQSTSARAPDTVLCRLAAAAAAASEILSDEKIG